MSYNNFKQSTVRGAFNNLNYPDNSIKASAYFQNDVSISGQLYTNNINTINLNSYNVSSLINSLSGSIYNNSINQNLYSISLSGRINDNYNIIQSNITSNYVPNLELLNYAKLYTNPLYLLDINGTMNATTIYENGTLLSSKYANITGNIATATRATNVSVTTDNNTSTSLYIPFTLSSGTNISVGLRVDPGIVYNAVTNTLTTTTFVGALTGNCSGSSGSCTGNATTSSRATNVSFSSDNTSTSLCLALTAASSSTTSAAVRLNSNLTYNALTNTLTSTNFNGIFNGNITGNLDGDSTTNYSIYPSLTTGNISIGNSLTTGDIKIGVNTQTGNIYIGSLNNNTYINGNVIYIGYDPSNYIYFNGLVSGSNINANTAITAQKITTGVNSFNDINISSISVGTTSKLFSKIIISANGEISYMYSGTGLYQSCNSGLNWVLIHTASSTINDICCSYTGQYVYYCTSATNKPQVSFNFGRTWANTGFSPGPYSQKIGCSYDGQIVVLVSGFSTPAFYFARSSSDFGTTVDSGGSGGFTDVNETINSVAVVGSVSSLTSVIIACGIPGNTDYVYYGSTMANISALSSLGLGAWSYVYTNSNNNVYLANIGNGIYKSINNGASFTQINGTAGENVYAVTASYDNSKIAYVTNSLFYYSSNGTTYEYYSMGSYNGIAISAMAKICLLLPTSTTDTIYSFNTNQNLILNNDVILPKQRLTLQSNIAYNYGSNTNIYYPYRTMMLQTVTPLTLTYPLYENYILTPTATTILNLPLLNEYTVGLKIYISKLSSQILTLTPASPNLIFAFNVYTGATSYNLVATASSCILLASYGTTTSASKFIWLIISQA